MCQSGTKLCHLVDIVNTFPCKEVKTIKVLLVVWEKHLSVWCLNTYDSLEDSTLTLLNPLSHRMEVSSEIAGSREYALVILAFTLAVQLFPPFTNIMQLGLIIHHYLYLLAIIVKSITNSCILGCYILGKRHVFSTFFLH